MMAVKFVEVGDFAFPVAEILWVRDSVDGLIVRMKTGDTSPPIPGVTKAMAMTKLDAVYANSRVEVTYASPDPPPAIP